MPIARYFVVVGSALAALLLIAGWCLPEPPASFPDRPEIIDRATIWIRSARKWPDKIVLDTNQPMIPPPSIEVAPAEQSLARLPDDTDQTSIGAVAKRNPYARPIDAHHPPARAKRRPARAFPSAHAARTRDRNEQPTSGTGEECCRSEWTDWSATSKTASRKRVAGRDSWTGWHFQEVD